MNIGLAHVRVGNGVALTPVDLEDPDTTQRIREGIARRRILLATGTCPCGASQDLAAAAAIGTLRREGKTVYQFAVPTTHGDDCPAGDPILNELLARFASASLMEM